MIIVIRFIWGWILLMSSRSFVLVFELSLSSVLFSPLFISEFNFLYVNCQGTDVPCPDAPTFRIYMATVNICFCVHATYEYCLLLLFAPCVACSSRWFCSLSRTEDAFIFEYFAQEFEYIHQHFVINIRVFLPNYGFPNDLSLRV